MAGSARSAIDRAVAVLECFSRKEPVLGIKEIAQKLDLQKSTVHRLLTMMVSQGLVARDIESQRYRLGHKLIHLGQLSARQYQLRDLALPVMRRVWEKVGETITLSIRIGEQRMYLDQIESLEEVRVTVDIGKPLPIYCGAGGKAFLAFMDPVEVDRILGSVHLKALTAATIVDPTRLREELALVRSRGYAVSLGERVAGVHAVSVPLRSDAGQVVAAVGISGPASRLTPDRLAERAPLLVHAAGEMSDMFGWALLDPHRRGNA
ncbi:MAG TPA: IclR family transcriptional regulator [Methylomirabilota bacterium]|jgi:DNA-binding IclR family transcriptional regulator